MRCVPHGRANHINRLFGFGSDMYGALGQGATLVKSVDFLEPSKSW